MLTQPRRAPGPLRPRDVPTPLQTHREPPGHVSTERHRDPPAHSPDGHRDPAPTALPCPGAHGPAGRRAAPPGPVPLPVPSRSRCRSPWPGPAARRRPGARGAERGSAATCRHRPAAPPAPVPGPGAVRPSVPGAHGRVPVTPSGMQRGLREQGVPVPVPVPIPVPVPGHAAGASRCVCSVMGRAQD